MHYYEDRFAIANYFHTVKGSDLTESKMMGFEFTHHFALACPCVVSFSGEANVRM